MPTSLLRYLSGLYARVNFDHANKTFAANNKCITSTGMETTGAKCIIHISAFHREKAARWRPSRQTYVHELGGPPQAVVVGAPVGLHRHYPHVKHGRRTPVCLRVLLRDAVARERPVSVRAIGEHGLRVPVQIRDYCSYGCHGCGRHQSIKASVSLTTAHTSS